MKALFLAAALLFASAAWASSPEESVSAAVVNVATSPKTLAVCEGADVVTTAYAVHTGIAHETNRLLLASVNAHHFLPMVLSKITIVGLIWWIYDTYKDSQAAHVGIGVATAATCAAATNNAAIIVRALKP